MGKILTIYGSSNTGKSTFAIKLANELSKENSVICIFTDNVSPTLSSYLSNLESEDNSLGKILSSQIISQDEILKQSVTVKNNKNLCFIGYGKGEHFKSYSEYTTQRANDVLLNLSSLADYVILDIPSHFIYDEFSKCALKMADKKIKLLGTGLKDISYEKSIDSYLSISAFNVNDSIKILSKVCDDTPFSILENHYGKTDLDLPFCNEIDLQIKENEILEQLSSELGKEYIDAIKELIKSIKGNEEIESEKIRNRKFSFPFNLKKKVKDE